MTVLPITEKQEAVNYPYGRLRTSAFFSIEFTKHGFRHVFQTINPKNGVLNKPKKDTYVHLAWIVLDEIGHYKQHGMNLSSYEDVNKMAKFIHENDLQLTKEMQEHIYMIMVSCIRANAMYTRADKDSLLDVITEPVKLLVHGIKTGENVFDRVFVDCEKIENLKGIYETKIPKP